MDEKTIFDFCREAGCSPVSYTVGNEWEQVDGEVRFDGWQLQVGSSYVCWTVEHTDEDGNLESVEFGPPRQINRTSVLRIYKEMAVRFSHVKAANRKG